MGSTPMAVNAFFVYLEPRERSAAAIIVMFLERNVKIKANVFFSVASLGGSRPPLVTPCRG